MTSKPSSKPHVPHVDESWLARNIEAPVAPALSVIDSHIHLWDFSDPDYFGDRYLSDARAAGISASVFVECTMGYREDGPALSRPVGEVEFARAQSERWSMPDVAVAAAIVGMVDVTRGHEIEPVLEEMAAAAGGRFRGIRIRAAYDADPAVGYGAGGVSADLLNLETTRAALAALQRAGLSLDIYAFHTQLADVQAVAAAFPDLPIVVNHIGAPIGCGPYATRREQVFRVWKAGMKELARRPNVCVKIGGFGISRMDIVSPRGRQAPPGSDELADMARPWFDGCIEAFGARRCMFGSNFPVDKNSVGMTTLVNAMKKLAGAGSEAEAADVLAGTARRFYRI